MTQQIKDFQSKILDRYALHRRDLPRRDSFDPYQVYVSETMSQQTQVDRVVPKFLNFMSEVPDFDALADIPRSDLLRLWSGLGFNSRALRLQQAAQRIISDYDGLLPRNRVELQSLPGVGPYMSASVLAFTYNMPEPVVDTNIRRVLIHELGISASAKRPELERIAQQCIPESRSNDRHNALMDYGALVATAKATGIRPVSKQSKFKGSDREVRGRILKHLTQKDAVLAIDTIHLQFPTKHIKKIVIGLQKDGFVRVDGDLVSIVDD